jgi:hypothetical protein
MKSELIKKRLILSLLGFIVYSVSYCQTITKQKDGSQYKDSDFVKVQFHESDSVFSNPGQGWMSSRLPSSIKYIRIGWSDLEPERGKYDWSAIDNAIARGKQKGVKVALRIMTCSPHSIGYYTSPKWLFDEGCKFHEYLVGGDDPTSGGARIPRIEPDYSDSLYLTRHNDFIKALGKRYDKSSDIEFLDIGSYGYWGEWHTPNAAPVEVRKKIVNMYAGAFKKTPLVFMTDDAEVLSYALDKGIGMRRDGVGSRWHEKTWIGSAKYSAVKGMADVWKHAPIVFEWYGNYDYLLQRGWSFDSAINFMLRNHVTIINDNIGIVPSDKMPQIINVAKYSGARFVLNEISHEKSIAAGSKFSINMKWTNTGVGKIYKKYVLRFFLLDQNDKVIYSFDGKADPSDWLPGELTITESVNLPTTLKKGTYRLALALENYDSGQPSFRLAIDTQKVNGSYIVSKVILK